MEIDDLPYEKIKSLLKEDHIEISLNLRIGALFLIIYENLKELITDKVKSFFTNEWEIVDGELVGKPDSKFGEIVRGKSVFRACRDFHLELGAITIEDDELISRFSKYRGEVAHELYAFLLDDKKTGLDIELLFEANRLATKIDRWWILEFEMAIDSEFITEKIDEDQVISGRQLFIDQLIRVALKDVLDSAEKATNET